MDYLIQQINENYSLDEISKLEVLLKNIKEKKEREHNASPSLYKFSSEYELYIGNTFTPKYLSSVRSSFIHLKKYFGEAKYMTDISCKDAENFKNYLINRVPKGYAVYLRTVKASFNVALKWGYVTANPFQKIKFLKKQLCKPIFLKPKDLDHILTFLSNQMIKEIVIFGFYTGCRLSEIINLKWNNIDLSKKIILIGDDQFRTKSGKQRVIPICKEVNKILTDLSKKTNNAEGYVFAKSNGFPYNKDYVSSSFKEASRKARIDEKIHFHTLRHSFASNLANKGVPIVVIKELMGHADISTTQIYSHTNLESLKAAINKFDLEEND